MRIKGSKRKSVQERAEELYSFIEKHGRAPISSELSPALRLFICQYSDGYENGLRKLGVEPLTAEEKSRLKGIMTDARWKMRILEYYKEIGKAPRVKDLQVKYGKYPPASIITKYSTVLKELGLKVNREYVEYNYTKEDCINMYKDLCERVGGSANSSDIKNDDLVPDFTVLIKDFGSLRKLQIESGVEVTSEEYCRYTKSEIIEGIKKSYNLIGEDIYIQSRLLETLRQMGYRYSIPTVKKYFREYGDYKDIISMIVSKECKGSN